MVTATATFDLWTWVCTWSVLVPILLIGSVLLTKIIVCAVGCATSRVSCKARLLMCLFKVCPTKMLLLLLSLRNWLHGTG